MIIKANDTAAVKFEIKTNNSNGGRLPEATPHERSAVCIYMIEIRNMSQRFAGPRGWVEALHNVNLTIPAGEVFGIIGRSGAGKSTLVRTINLLTRPSEGNVIVNGRDLTTLPAPELRDARREIGMIFQHFNLLSSRTVFENVALPLELAGMKRAEIEANVCRSSNSSASRRRRIVIRRRSAAGRSSAWASRGRWRASRRCCSPTKPLPRSIQKPRAQSSTCFAGSIANSA